MNLSKIPLGETYLQLMSQLNRTVWIRRNASKVSLPEQVTKHIDLDNYKSGVCIHYRSETIELNITPEFYLNFAGERMTSYKIMYGYKESNGDVHYYNRYPIRPKIAKLIHEILATVKENYNHELRQLEI